ncbi:MAG: CDP-alcohol phosphatidyltransferase family protein [Pseudomonadota bacterium]
MFDARLRRLIDPPLNVIGRRLARVGLSANVITIAGLLVGLSAAVLIGFGYPMLAIVPLLTSRLADGIDGAVARATGGGPTSFGGFLDITCDFIFYGSIPLAFAVLDPDANAFAAAFLLFSFYANGSAFLAFAIVAEKEGIETSAQGQKTLYYVAGLLEGAETIGFFILLCLLPGYFAPLAWGFGAICTLSAVLRIWLASRVFR